MDGAATRGVVRAAALAACMVAACGHAAAAGSERTYEATMSVAEATGHDCLPLDSQEVTIDLVVGMPAPDGALAGFAGGFVLRWRHDAGTLRSDDDHEAAPLERIVSADGAPWSFTAPGTETCRWSGTLKARAAQLDEARTRQLTDLEAANVLFAQGDALLAKGNGDEARPLYDRAVAMRAAVLGAEHALTLRAQLRVARALQVSGRAGPARELAERLLASQERAHGESFDTLRMRAAVGMMLWSEGRPQDALPVMQRAYDELRERHGASHLETLLAQNNLALVLWDLGRLSEAASHLEFQLPRMAAIRGESHQRTLDAMNNLGLIYQGLGRHAAALELLERAYRLSVAALGPVHSDTLTTLLSVAVGYAHLDRIEDALSLYRVCHEGLRKALGDDHPWTLAAQSNIAASLLDLQRVVEARPIAIDLVARAERAMGPTHVYTLRWSGMLGGTLYQLGDFAAAAREYGRVHAGQAKAFGDEHPDTLESLANLGQTLYYAGERARGAAMLERALADLRRVDGPGHRVTLTALAGLADVMVAERRRADAIALLRELVDAVERLRIDEGLARETRQAFFARWSAGYKRLALLHGAREPADAFRVAELSKARTLLESLALRNADMAGIVGGEDAARLATLDARASEVAHAMARAERGDEAFKLESERNALMREAAALRRELRVRYPRYAALSEVELVDAIGVRRLARAGEVLVSYLVADDEVLAFVARPGRPLAVRPLGRVDGLASSVHAYRTLLAGQLAGARTPVWRRRDGSFVAALVRPDDAAARVEDAGVVGRTLAARLVTPLEGLFAGARRLVVSPDGALATLPFEALPYRGRALVAAREVTYVQSLSVLASMRARPATSDARATLLAVGAPAFTHDDAAGGVPAALAERLSRSAVGKSVSRSYAARGIRWSELPGAEREIEAVAALFAPHDRVVAVRAEASERRLHAMNESGALAGFRYLLFATHGYLDTEVPARSALVLSDVDRDARFDGYLTAAKWPAYRLDSELAVLSACETGLGRQLQGEGVMGLPYAMFVAGNRATVLTLWRIDDEATTAFVAELFRRVRDGASVSSALASTKRAFLAHSGLRRSPAVWAPFVLYGG